MKIITPKHNRRCINNHYCTDISPFCFQWELYAAALVVKDVLTLSLSFSFSLSMHLFSPSSSRSISLTVSPDRVLNFFLGHKSRRKSLQLGRAQADLERAYNYSSMLGDVDFSYFTSLLLLILRFIGLLLYCRLDACSLGLGASLLSLRFLPFFPCWVSKRVFPLRCEGLKDKLYPLWRPQMNKTNKW